MGNEEPVKLEQIVVGEKGGGGRREKEKKNIPVCDQRVTALTEKELKLPKGTQPPSFSPSHTYARRLCGLP